MVGLDARLGEHCDFFFVQVEGVLLLTDRRRLLEVLEVQGSNPRLEKEHQPQRERGIRRA